MVWPFLPKFNIYLGLFSTEFHYFVSARQRMFLNFCFRATKGTFLRWNTFYSTLLSSTMMPPLAPLCPSSPQKRGPFPKSHFTVPHMSHSIHQIKSFRRRQKNPKSLLLQLMLIPHS